MDKEKAVELLTNVMEEQPELKKDFLKFSIIAKILEDRLGLSIEVSSMVAFEILDSIDEEHINLTHRESVKNSVLKHLADLAL